MKKAVSILSLAVLFSCNSNKTESENKVTEEAKTKAAEVTTGATTAPPASAPATKKYESKSGIVTFETKMNVSGMAIKTKQVIYFDDNGNKECKEEYETDPVSGKETVNTKTIAKDGYTYVYSIKNKSGMKTKTMGTGVAAKFDMTEVTDKMKKENQWKELPGETICGKSCSAFSMVTPSGNIKMYGWNHITLKTVVDNPSMKMKSETAATKIEEDAPIPAEIFEIPADVKFTEN